MRRDSDWSSSRVASDNRLGQAYSEDAFRYLLTFERKRSERSGCVFLLLLVDLKEEPGQSVRIDSLVSSKIFSRLCLCLRETDFVGWYREERVAGAVLTQLDPGPRPEVSRAVRQRVSAVLGEGLPPDVTRRLQVRVYQLGPSLKGG
jgi:hypothetical protein